MKKGIRKTAPPTPEQRARIIQLQTGYKPPPKPTLPPYDLGVKWTFDDAHSLISMANGALASLGSQLLKIEAVLKGGGHDRQGR